MYYGDVRFSGRKYTEEEKQWLETEAQFRVWAFHVYWDKLYSEERDMAMRFAKALVASIAEVKDPLVLLKWKRTHERKVAWNTRNNAKRHQVRLQPGETATLTRSFREVYRGTPPAVFSQQEQEIEAGE